MCINHSSGKFEFESGLLSSYKNIKNVMEHQDYYLSELFLLT